MKLIPTWKDRLRFDVEKQDNFHYKDRSSKEFKRQYQIEIEQQDNFTFEAYYPDSLLNQIKLLNVFEDFIYNNSKNITKTLFYEVDENFAFEETLNKDETIESIKKDCELLEQHLVDEEEKEELNMRLEAICESQTKFQRHILDDLINIHYNYGLDIEPEYYFDLHKESTTKKILKKLFPKSKYILKRVNWMRHSLSEKFIKIEYLKGIENITSGYKPNWQQIEEEFGDGEFKVDKHPNLTLNHEVYVYDKENMILEFYEKLHVIDSPIMRKEVKHKIKKADI
jgi:hypothetical protein